MRKLRSKLEAMFAAAAFAEEGDAETAREVLRDVETSAPSTRERAEPELASRRHALARRRSPTGRRLRAASRLRQRA